MDRHAGEDFRDLSGVIMPLPDVDTDGVEVGQDKFMIFRAAGAILASAAGGAIEYFSSAVRRNS